MHDNLRPLSNHGSLESRICADVENYGGAVFHNVLKTTKTFSTPFWKIPPPLGRRARMPPEKAAPGLLFYFFLLTDPLSQHVFEGEPFILMNFDQILTKSDQLLTIYVKNRKIYVKKIQECVVHKLMCTGASNTPAAHPKGLGLGGGALGVGGLGYLRLQHT